MAGRQIHVLQIAYIPGADNDTAGVGVVLDRLYRFADLVDESAVVVGPRTPLIAVDMTQITVFVRPFVPDAYTVFLQVFRVRIALQEPEQLVDDGFQMQLSWWSDTGNPRPG